MPPEPVTVHGTVNPIRVALAILLIFTNLNLNWLQMSAPAQEESPTTRFYWIGNTCFYLCIKELDRLDTDSSAWISDDNVHEYIIKGRILQ